MKSLKPIYTSSRLLIYLYRFTLVLIALQFCRLTFYLSNLRLFGHLGTGDFTDIFLGGLLFDGAALGYALSLFTLLSFIGAFLPQDWERSRLYQGLVKFFYFVPTLLVLFVNIADAGYYPFTLRRTTISIFKEFRNDSLIGMLPRFIAEYWYLSLVFILLTILLIMGYRWIRFELQDRLPSLFRFLITAIEMAVITAGILLWIRGDLYIYNRPMTIMKANIFVKSPEDRSLVLNTMFTLIRTSQRNSLEEYHFIPQEELSKHISPFYRAEKINDQDSLFGAYKGRNIMLIVLESFGRNYIGSMNKDLEGFKSYTPFLDSLIQESLTFQYSFANGRISVEAMPSAMVSIPGLGIDFVLSHYATNTTFGLPRHLAQSQGYSSCFYHGAPKGSMGFDAFVHQLGVQNYYGMKEHDNDTDYNGSWGIDDEPFLQSVAQAIPYRGKEPFFGTIFTLSSHNPFIVPEKYRSRFTGGDLPIHKVIQYSDYSLQRFFETIREKEWFDRTLFVIMADHCSHNDLALFENPSGVHAIPIIFYDPQGGLPKGLFTEYVAQQIDILPTLLYLQGDSTKIFSYGANLFDPNQEHFGVFETKGTYYLVNKKLLVTLDQEGKTRVYPPYPHIQYEGLEPREVAPEDAEKYTNKLKAIVQDFNYRMIHNKLLPDQEETKAIGKE